MDTKSISQRSINMSHIKSTDTKPELLVRKCLWNQGIRYRLYNKTLPGRPDILLSKFKTVIFINGCFWHQHQVCKRKSIPKSNEIYWAPKLKRNVDRFNEQAIKLHKAGFKVFTIWECEAKKLEVLEPILQKIINEIS